MNRVLLGAAVALVVLIVGVLAAPSFIDWNRYRGEIAALVEAALGRAVVIGGDVDFTLLPSPALVANQVRVANADGATSPNLISLGRLDIRVAFGPLLRGNVVVRSIVLQEPVIEVEILADGRSNWSMAPGTRGGVPEGVQIDSVLVRNGTVTLRDTRRGLTERLQGVEAEISARGMVGPYLGTGTFTYRGMPARFAFNSAAAVPGRPTAVRAEATFEPGDNRLEFRGSIAEHLASGGLAGTLTVEGKNLATLVERVARAFQMPPPAIAGFAVPVRLTTQVTLKGNEAGLNDLDLRIGDLLAAKGAINIALAATPRVDATLAVNQFDLDAVLARLTPGALPVAQQTARSSPRLPGTATSWPPAGWNGSLALSVEALTYRGRPVRGIEVTANLAGGTVAIDRAHALLPGASDIEAKGRISNSAGVAQFDGEVAARSDNLRDFLGWIGVDTARVPGDRVRTIALNGRLRLRPDLVQAYGFDLRLDSTVATGAAAYAFRARPAFSIDVDVDRLDIDGYLPGGLSDLRMPLATLDRFDTDIRLRAGTLRVAEQEALGVVVDTGLAGGVLTVREVSVFEYAGARGTLTGIASGFAVRTSATGTINIAATSPAGIARALGVDFLRAPERLGAFVFNASVDGDFDRLIVDAGALVAGAELRMQGNVRALGRSWGLSGGRSGDLPTVELAFEARHGDLAGLIQSVGLGTGAATESQRVPLRLRGTASGAMANLSVELAGEFGGAEARAVGTLDLQDALGYHLEVAADLPDAAAGLGGLGLRYRPAPDVGMAALRATIDGTANTLRVTALQGSVGEAQVTGDVALSFGSARRAIAANLVIGTVRVDRLLPEPKARAGAPPPGEWSGDPLPFWLLRNTDLDLDVTAERIDWRGASFTDAVLIASARDDALRVSPLRAKAFGGEIEVSVTVTVGDAASVSGTLLLRDIDIAAAPPIRWAVVPAAGRATVHADIATRGADLHELVANLAGTTYLSATDGALYGLSLGQAGDGLDGLKDLADLPDLLQRLTTQGETPFRAIEATGRIADGVVSVEGLKAGVDGARISGGGIIDLPLRRTALELTVALLERPEAPPFTLELSGPWEQPRRLTRSRELQGYLARRIAAAPTPVPTPDPAAAAAPAPGAPPPLPFEQQIRGLLEGLGRP